MSYLRPLIATVVIAGTAMASVPAFADVTDARQARQATRIEQGVRNGSLTPAETGKLVNEQRNIQALERSAKKDGYVDPIERRQLQAAQDRASRNIRAEKHDFEDRRHNRGRHYAKRWNGNRWVWGWGPRWYY
ncbi:MAG: hypothetical protein K2Y05_07535 [Hyphomicrobiaceae bacterium]|nr:hypothetical protein [Hyphomicrobiaceae bacterium]